MHVSVKNTGWLPVLLPVVFAFTLPGSPAHAEDTRTMGHRVVREKILRDSGGRSDVRFLTSDILRRSRRWLRVLGKGTFRKRDKRLQAFTYQITIDPRTGSYTEVSYRLR